MPNRCGHKALLIFAVLMVSSSIASVSGRAVEQSWVDQIESYLLQVDRDTSAEIVVYVAQSLRGHGIKDSDGAEISEIVQLGVYIFNELSLPTPNGDVKGIGKTGLDNGVLVLVAMAEHEWRIETGYGVEGDVTDIEAMLIGENRLVPKFQEGSYGEGLYDTVVALAAEIPKPSTSPNLPIRGRYFYENLNPPLDQLPSWVATLIAGIVLGVLVVVVVVIVYLVKTGRMKLEKGRSRTWGTGGYGGGGRSPSGGARGGGGRSGGGGAKGKW